MCMFSNISQRIFSIHYICLQTAKRCEYISSKVINKFLMTWKTSEADIKYYKRPKNPPNMDKDMQGDQDV